MRLSTKQGIFAAVAVLGMTACGAIAAPGDATHARPSVPSQQSKGHHSETTIEHRIADLHAKLRISPEQQPQWDIFSGVMRDNARDMDQAFHQRMNTLGSMTAVENLQSYAQVAGEHAESIQKLIPAFQALYGTMSDTQKKIADRVFRAEVRHGAPARHG